jgi:hypothetical protein
MAAAKGRKGGKRKGSGSRKSRGTRAPADPSSTKPRKRKGRAIAAAPSTPKGKGRTRTKPPRSPPPPPSKGKRKRQSHEQRIANYLAKHPGATRQEARGHRPREHREPNKLFRDRVRRAVKAHEAHGARMPKEAGRKLEMSSADFEREIRRILAQPYGWETWQEIRDVREGFRQLYKEMGSGARQMTLADLEEEAERLDCDVRLLFYRSVTWA